jgi:hypothetical protein
MKWQQGQIMERISIALITLVFFELLNEAIHKHKHVKTWIKPFATTHDGCSAWLVYKAHCHGSSEFEAIETATENPLDTLVYHGKKLL